MNSKDSMTISEQVITAIRTVVGSSPAVLHEPTFNGNEWRYVKECLDSTFVSSVGEFVNRFETDLADFTGSTYVIAVVNGTAALHIALMLAGVKSGDEVLIPPLSFVATANAVVYCGANPHFVDCHESTLGIDPVKLRDYLSTQTELRSGHCVNKSTGRIIRAMVPVHTFGHPVDLEGLISIARDYKLVMIEDAAESIGSYYDNQHTGTFSKLGILSFNGNKTVTTGGGGAILTGDVAVAKHARHITTTAKMPHAWEYRHDDIGYNYRLPNLNAALGCAQLEQLPTILAAKRELFRRYEQAFTQVSNIKLISEPEKCHSNYWLQTILMDQDVLGQRNRLLEATNNAGYMTRPAWSMLHESQPFKNCPKMDLSCACSLAARLVNIPSSPSLIPSEL